MGTAPLSVAVLAGGQSRRMGRDKALVEFGGRPLLDRVLERLRGIGDEVFVVASDRPAYAGFGVPVVPDRLPGGGALCGIHAAIATARNPHCLVVACDMPFLSPALLSYMAALPRDYDVLIPVLAAGHRGQGGAETLEALHAIYGKNCLPAIERRIAAGRLKVIEFFSDVRVRRIHEAAVRGYDPDLLSFVNANTPAEMARAREVGV